MFFRKTREYIPSACVTCGCLIEKGREQRVTLQHSEDTFSTTSSNFVTYWGYPAENVYCGKCRPPYDKVHGAKFFLRVPEHFIEVTEDGKEIKPTTK